MPTPTCEIQPMEHRYRGIGSGNIGTGEPGNIGTGEHSADPYCSGSDMSGYCRRIAIMELLVC